MDDSYASLPGKLGLNPLQWLSYFPRQPIILFFGLAFSCFLMKFHWLFLIPSVLFARWNFYYWQRIKEHFAYGCINASVIVSENPVMFAVATNLSKSSGYNYPVVKIVESHLRTVCGKKVKVGTRFPSVALYGRGSQDDLPHWIDFKPLPVDYATSSKRSIMGAMNRLSESDWSELDEWLKLVPMPLVPGLYHVDVQQKNSSEVNDSQPSTTSNFGINDFSANVLAAIRDCSSIPFAFMYQSQFEKINLDFSLRSLELIDSFLRGIRNQFNPKYEDIVNSGEGRLFLHVVTIYSMATIAKAGGYTVKWFNYDDFKEMVPSDNPPQYCFESTFICVINGAIRMSLGVATDVIFEAPMGIGFVNYADNILKESPDYSQFYTELEKISLLDSQVLELADDLLLEHQSLVDLSERMGLLIAQTVAHAPSDNFGVTLLAPSVEEGQLRISFIKFMGSNASEMQGHLRHNPHHKEWLVGVYDGYVYPYSGKIDALIFEARSYIEGNIINIYLPYSYDGENKFFRPMLIGCWSKMEVEIITKSILKQIKNIPIAVEAWQKYCQM